MNILVNHIYVLYFDPWSRIIAGFPYRQRRLYFFLLKHLSTPRTKKPFFATMSDPKGKMLTKGIVGSWGGKMFVERKTYY